MNYNEIGEDISKMMRDLENSNINKIEIEFPNGLKIKMDKGLIPIKNNISDNENQKSTVSTVNNNVAINLNEEPEKEECFKIIKSPMVGTFYKSSSPGAEAFVKVGDKVKKGQVVCIVEAMKLMNEIESEFDGEIVEVCLQNEDMVEYGTPLFKIK